MRLALLPLAALLCCVSASAGEGPWIDLFAHDFDAFRPLKTQDWFLASDVGLDPANPKKLLGKAGKGNIWVNGETGRGSNLFTKQNFGDVEAHLEFMMAKSSNSGIKFHGHYEIQLYDSYGKPADKLDGSDCGGVYPRAEAKPKYHHIDHGIPPKVNACKVPGEWQTLDIVFLAPRFDKEGKKIANARLPKVVLNGQVIHQDTELKTPTGDRWNKPEMAEGPIMIQGDHGPVALRNVKVRVPEKR
jgi:hypothetical protein